MTEGWVLVRDLGNAAGIAKALVSWFQDKNDLSDRFKVLTRETVWGRREDSVVPTTYKQEQAVPSSPATQSNKGSDG